jgi:aspartate-semialdehyde dehydrogenase
MKIAVVGATGMVGEVMLKVLAEKFLSDTDELILQRGQWVKIDFNGKSHHVVGLATAVAMQPDIALFSAGGETSLEWAPKFAAAGTTVIDNSSAWRMDPTKN